MRGANTASTKISSSPSSFHVARVCSLWQTRRYGSGHNAGCAVLPCGSCSSPPPRSPHVPGRVAVGSTTPHQARVGLRRLATTCTASEAVSQPHAPEAADECTLPSTCPMFLGLTQSCGQGGAGCAVGAVQAGLVSPAQVLQRRGPAPHGTYTARRTGTAKTCVLTAFPGRARMRGSNTWHRT